MAEYMKREDAIAVIEEKQKELCPVGRYGRGYVYGSDREKYDSLDEIIDALQNIPNADVVPVVRCRDCAHLYGTLCTVCGLLPRKPDDFCSLGERKDGADHEAD